MNKLVDIISWFRIFISPTLIGAIIGLFVYLKMNNNIGFIFGILITTIGGILGIIWATKIRQKEGARNFISRIDASPELDNKEL